MKNARTALCWLVHALTASSAVLGIWSIYFATRQQMHLAFLLLLLTILIDSIDGPIARAVNVKKYTNEFDGALLDNIVDFFTWTLAPCFYLIHQPLFPFATTLALTSGIIFASSYQFCCQDAKIGGRYFKRFPSVWSPTIIALYLLPWPSALKCTLLVICIVFSFIPIYVPKPFYNATMHLNKHVNSLFNFLNNIENIALVSACIIGALLYPHPSIWVSMTLSVCIPIRIVLWLTTSYTVHRHQLDA